MNNIEKLHLEAIQNNRDIRKETNLLDYGTSPLELNIASVSTQTTENVAIDFLDYVASNYYYNSGIWRNKETDESKLRKKIYEEFVNNKK